MTGLRLQILSILALLTVVSSGLLGMTLISMATSSVERSLDGHIDTIQVAAASSMGKLLAVGASGDHLEEMARYWLETGSIDGIYVFDGSGDQRAEYSRDGYRDVLVRPSIPTAAPGDRVNATGGAAQRSRFVQVPAGRGLGCVVVGTDMGRLTAPMQPVRSLTIMYLILHAVMILAASYFALTLLIVRPVEKLRSAASRLGKGQFNVPIDTGSGGKEIRDLAEAIAQTAHDLESQRRALETKIDELERAQAEIGTKEQAIIRSEKLASVGRLAAGVAHEIGNPLSVILGFLEILRDTKMPEHEKEEYLARMQSEAERVNRIIRDLLAYSRSGDGTPAPVDLGEVVENALAILAPQKIMRGVTVSVHGPSPAPAAMATRDRMTQLVVNLVLNAAEAMVGEGSLRIIIRAPDGEGQVVMTFEDDGPGIDPAILDDIFDPFVTTKPEHEGTGLGLAVCQGIVHGFGGSLSAFNRQGGGATFEARLPLFDPEGGNGRGEG